jgi:hypothetical protein
MLPWGLKIRIVMSRRICHTLAGIVSDLMDSVFDGELTAACRIANETTLVRQRESQTFIWGTYCPALNIYV